MSEVSFTCEVEEIEKEIEIDSEGMAFYCRNGITAQGERKNVLDSVKTLLKEK